MATPTLYIDEGGTETTLDLTAGSLTSIMNNGCLLASWPQDQGLDKSSCYRLYVKGP